MNKIRPNIIHYVSDKIISFDSKIEILDSAIRILSSDKLFELCLKKPFTTLVITYNKICDDVPQNIPCVVFSTDIKYSSKIRLNYNTLFLNNYTESSQDKLISNINDFLKGLSPNIISLPICNDNSNLTFWQYPVITEKYCLESVAKCKNSSFIYVGIPFATIIDKNYTPIKELASLKSQIDGFKKKYPTIKIVTACQHIHYNKILSILEYLEITDIYLSHKKSDQFEINKIRVHGLPLYPVNILDNGRRIGIPEQLPLSTKRQYLFSFIGAHMNHYLHPIRKTILSWQSSIHNHYFIKDTGIWHFEKDVYQHQVRGRELEVSEKDSQMEQTKIYNNILANSTFSLCPVGAGPNTIRLWESICTGSIPIIIADEYSILDSIPSYLRSKPFYIQLSYKSPSLISPESLELYLQKYSETDILSMQNQCYLVADYLKSTFINLESLEASSMAATTLTRSDSCSSKSH